MNRKKIALLVNPWIHDFAAFDFWIKPLGLLSLAAVLRKNGFTVRLVDCLDPHHPSLRNQPVTSFPKRHTDGSGKFRKEKIDRPEPLKALPKPYHRYGIPTRLFEESVGAAEKPDVVLVTSMMTYWYPGVADAIRIVRRIWPGVPIILGGVYATLCTEHAALHCGADYILPREGERELPRLLRGLLHADFRDIPDTRHLDSFPHPAFDLLSGLDQVPILTSRGCPFRCTYCASHLLSPCFRRRDPLLVAEEIAFWNRSFGVRNFSLYDDAFLCRPREIAVPLLQEVIRRNMDCRFHCPNGLHLREVTDEIARLFFQARVETIRFGFETSNETAQVVMGGKAKNRDLMEAIQSFTRAGYDPGDIGIYLLCGLPGQTAEEVMESIRFVRSAGARPILAEYSPIPGTGLWQQAVKASSYPLEAEPLYQNNSLLPCRNSLLSYEDYIRLKKATRARVLPRSDKRA